MRTFHIPGETDVLFQSNIEETSRIAKDKVDAYINARRYSPKQAEEDKHDNGSGEKEVSQTPELGSVSTPSKMVATFGLHADSTEISPNSSKTAGKKSQPSSRKSRIGSARKEKNKNLRSPYKTMNRDMNGTGPTRSRTDEDAISAGEWASALGMAGERLKLASPNK